EKARPLEGALGVDQLRLEDVEGEAQLEASPRVHPGLQGAPRALDAPERIGREPGRDPEPSRGRGEHAIAAVRDALDVGPREVPLTSSRPASRGARAVTGV